MLIDDATLAQLRQDTDLAWTALANAIRAQWGRKTEQAVGRTDAEDLLQEVFVRIFSHVDRITDVGHLERFVARVWRQRVIERYRQRSKVPGFASMSAPPDEESNGPVFQDLPGTDKAADPQRHAISEELRGILERIAPLTAEQRLIVALHVFDGCTLAEIADLLKQKVKTVETWYGRAVALIGRQLALAVYRDCPADFDAVLSETQKQAFGHLLSGLPVKKTAKALGLRVPELARLLAPAWEILGRAAQADWLRDL